MSDVPLRLADDADGRSVWAVPPAWTIYWRSPGAPPPPHQADILIAQAATRAADERARKALELAADALAGSTAARQVLERMIAERAA